MAGEDRDSAIDYVRLLHEITVLALDAAVEIEAVAAGDFDVSGKADQSPVTEADRRAERLINTGLSRHFPSIPIVAEEACAVHGLPDRAYSAFFLVDPLDGTKEFVARRSDYTVNIALIENGVPVAGVVCAPKLRMIYRGFRPGNGSSLAEKALLDGELKPKMWSPIALRAAPQEPVIVASRSHVTPETQAFLDRHANCERVSVGSSLKFCLVAEGSADIYPRFGPTMEWDTAAGDAVLRAAGGMTRTLDGATLAYGKAGSTKFLNPFFIAAGRDYRP